jgi:hypothetical protein
MNSNTLDNFNTTTNQYLGSIFDNKYASAVISLILALYAAFAAPRLPKGIAHLFNKWWVKLIFMMTIAYVATRNPIIAIVASVGLMVSIQAASKFDLSDEFEYVQDKVGDIKDYIVDKAEDVGEFIGDKVEDVNDFVFNNTHAEQEQNNMIYPEEQNNMIYPEEQNNMIYPEEQNQQEQAHVQMATHESSIHVQP